MWSWFPPPADLEADSSGYNQLTWTESVFLKILSDARDGKGKPKSLTNWRSKLHEQQFTHILIKHNESWSQAFMDRVVPVVNQVHFFSLVVSISPDHLCPQLILSLYSCHLFFVAKLVENKINSEFFTKQEDKMNITKNLILSMCNVFNESCQWLISCLLNLFRKPLPI